MQRVGLVATGDELVKGDILNTNGQYMAQAFFDAGITLGQQVIVGDSAAEIASGIEYLMQTHSTIITIGGLGPTCDDVTRNGLSVATQRPLVFFPEAWDWIVEHLTHKKLAIPETNRQQALLPEGARPIHNLNGTAAACHLTTASHQFFMLPGPPNECRPIFDAEVLPTLLGLGYAQKSHYQTWLLFGSSEGDIAALLEPITQGSDCDLGYRVHLPYLEIKLRSQNHTVLTQLGEQFDRILQPWLVSRQRKTASAQLIEWLKNHPKIGFQFQDHATGGRLEATLKQPETAQQCQFGTSLSSSSISVLIKGLDDYWQQKTTDFMPLTLWIEHQKTPYQSEKAIPFRKAQSLDYAVEWIALELLRWIDRQTTS